MDFELSDTHRAIRRSARELAENEFAENAFTWHGDVPEKHRRLLADHGFLGMTLPEEWRWWDVVDGQSDGDGRYRSGLP